MTQQATRPLFQAAGVITAALVLSKLMGYVRESLLANRFGATHTMDAYVVAQDIPSSLFAALSTSLVILFIPVYHQVLQERGETAARRMVNLVLHAALLVGVALLVLGWILSPILVRFLVPGLPDRIQALTATLTRTMLLMLPFMGLSGVSAAVLNAHRQFAAPALAGLVINASLIVSLLMVSHPNQIGWVANATVLGMVMATLIQVLFLPRNLFTYRLQWDATDPDLTRIGRLIIPILITTGAIQMQNVVDRYMSSGLAEGSISALNYAMRMTALPYGVIGVAITTVLYPHLTEQVAANRLDALREVVRQGLRTLTWVLLPMAVGLLVFREPIVRLFLQRGAFNAQAAGATMYAMQFFVPGILFFGWLDFLNRSYFALQDPWTPMWAGAGMVIVNIGLNLILLEPMGIGGIALGTSLSAAIAAGVLLWGLGRRVGAMDGATMTLSLLINLATSLTGSFCGYLGYQVVQRVLPDATIWHEVARLGVGLSLTLLVHVALGLLLGIRDGEEILFRIGRRKPVHRP